MTRRFKFQVTHSTRRTVKITHWLLKVLQSPKHNPRVMRWEDEENGVFRIMNHIELGRMWGLVKANPDMDFEKLR